MNDTVANNRNAYVQERDRIITEREGIRNFIYLDTRGIPTTSRGIALVTVNAATVNGQTRYRWSVTNEAAQYLRQGLR